MWMARPEDPQHNRSFFTETAEEIALTKKIREVNSEFNKMVELKIFETPVVKRRRDKTPHQEHKGQSTSTSS
jgi:hypothetical protein